MIYSSLNKPVFLNVPVFAKTILDVGCGTGEMGKALKAGQKERIVCGVTYLQEEYDIATTVLDKVWMADINKDHVKIDERFDCIIFSHVLEHTYSPTAILKYFSHFLDTGIIIIALPNVLYYKQRIEFLKGRFKYALYGLLDYTHFRFFDWETAQAMITEAGLEITFKKADGHFPLAFLRSISRYGSRLIDRFSLKRWPGLFGFQFIFIAKK
jgi:2-polyprenyl-3-methyl-5-hydroxy-6-metoxy-1,4-benzoquinol methylase